MDSISNHPHVEDVMAMKDMLDSIVQVLLPISRDLETATKTSGLLRLDGQRSLMIQELKKQKDELAAIFKLKDEILNLEHE